MGVEVVWGQRSGDERCVSEQQLEVSQQSVHVGDRSSPIIKGGKLGHLTLLILSPQGGGLVLSFDAIGRCPVTQT